MNDKVSGNKVYITQLDENGKPTGEPVEVEGVMSSFDLLDGSGVMDLDPAALSGFDLSRGIELDFVVSSPDLVRLLSQPWRLNTMFADMGAHDEFDYADDAPKFEDRLTRCYELSARAMLDRLDSASHGKPRPEYLVHGSWHGPGAPARINHAWVLLSDGSVWEPISALLYDREKFYNYAKCIEVVTYTELQMRLNMATSGHYGPWHDEED